MRLSRRSVRKAILLIEDSKQSHLNAITDPDNQILGDEAFHKKCVKEYKLVLRVLRWVEKTNG